MLQNCARDLERVAPGDPLTLSAVSDVKVLAHPGRSWVGWFAIAVAAIGTLVDAVRRRGRRGTVAVAGALVVLAMFGARTASADDHPGLSKYPVDDKDPSSTIPTEEQRSKNPVEMGYWLMDLAEKATRASKKGDHEAAARYYTAMSKAVPDKPVSFVHLCSEYEALGNTDMALQSCRAALFLQPVTVDDYVHYLRILVGRPEKLTSQDIAAAADVIKHLREDPAGRAQGNEWECQLAVRLQNVPLLEACTKALDQGGTDPAGTTIYKWTLALLKGDLSEAHRLSAQARTVAVPQDIIDRLDRETSTLESKRSLNRLLVAGAMLLGFVALGALIVLGRQKLASKPGDSLPPPPEPREGAPGIA